MTRVGAEPEALLADGESGRGETDPSATSNGGQRYGKLAKQGVVWSFMREGVSEMIATPTAMVMARLLTPFDFGIAASAGFFLTLATRLTNFGFNQAIVRVKVLRPEHCSSVFAVNLLIGVAAYAILVSSAGLMAEFFHAPQVGEVVPIAALTFLISPVGTVPAALMSRNMLFKRTASADWIGSLAECSTAIWSAWSGHGFWSVVYGRVAGDIANTAVKVGLAGWRPSLRFSRTAIAELFSFGSGVFAKRLLDYFAKNLDNLVVGRVLGVVSLGFYDKAFMTVEKALVRINTGGPMVSFRIFSIISEEPDRFRRAYRRVILAASLVSYPALASLASLGPDLIVVLYGERWLPAAVPFQILCAAGALKVLNEYAGSAAQAWGGIWGQVWRQALYATLVVLLVAAFSPWGLAGAAAGVLVATAGMTVLMNSLLMRLTGLTAPEVLRPQVPGAVVAMSVAALVVLTQWALTAQGWAAWQRLVLEGLVAAIGYITALKLTPFGEVRALLREVAQDVAPPVGRFMRLLA